MQQLLRWADWDVDGVRDDLSDHGVAAFGDQGGVLFLDSRGRGRPERVAFVTVQSPASRDGVDDDTRDL